MNTTLNQSMHHGGGNMKGYNPFPKLTIQEIIDCLKELGVAITKEVIVQPESHKDTIRQLFEMLAINLLGIQSEELSQPAFHGLEAISYPQLHDESIPQLNGIKAIMKLMEVSEISDFSTRDLTTPSQSRLIRQLSGIMNFAKFREERVHMLFELNGQTQSLIDQLAIVTEKNDASNNRLLLLREQTKEDLSILNSLENDCSEFETKIQEAKRDIFNEENNQSSLSTDLTNVSSAIVENYRVIEELKTELRELSMQVVTSPEKFRKQILDVGQSLQFEQKDCKNAEKRVKELSSWLVNVEEANGECLSALEAIQEVRGEVEKQKIMIGDLDNQKQVVESLRSVLSELNQSSQQLQRKTMKSEEKLNQLRKQSTTRSDETKKTIDDLHKQLVEAESFRVQVRIR
jgi:kinetochore protein Nuf2